MEILKVTALQLLAHGVGDYWFQSDWMANEKTKANFAAVCHATTYTIPFIAATQSPIALAIICVSHFVIDRWRLARYLCYAKNFLAPSEWWHPWEECSGTGYHKDRPAWMAVWLMIIADNLAHVICNAIAIQYFGN